MGARQNAVIVIGLLVFIMVFAIFDPFGIIQKRAVVPTEEVPGPGPGLPEDGIYSITKWFTNTVDDLGEHAQVTATSGYALMPDGEIIEATTLAAGATKWSGYRIKEGDVILIEIDSSTNFYPTQAQFKVGDITIGDSIATDGYTLGTVECRGMDVSEDAAVVLVTSGTSTLFNGTAEEDQLAVDAGNEYTYNLFFDWQAADEEWFGIEHQTTLVGQRYEYAPYIQLKTTDLVILEDFEQDGIFLTLVHHHDDGAAAYYIYEMMPIPEDEDKTEDGKSYMSWTMIFPLAAADTLDITFYGEHRTDRARAGIMTGAVETVATLTTT